MKISCTVEEFAKLVRGCNETSRMMNCAKCPLYDLCDNNGYIEQFVTHDSITHETPKVIDSFLEKKLNIAEGSAQDACD